MKLSSHFYQKITIQSISSLIFICIVCVLSLPHVARSNSETFLQDAATVLTDENPVFTFGSTHLHFPISETREPRLSYTVVATAYSSDPWQTDDSPFLPADGVDYREELQKRGAVYAIASNDHKLGTKIRLPELYGDTIFTVRDRMNSRYTGKYRVDVYIVETNKNGDVDTQASREKAKQFGVQWTTMEVF